MYQNSVAFSNEVKDRISPYLYSVTFKDQMKQISVTVADNLRNQENGGILADNFEKLLAERIEMIFLSEVYAVFSIDTVFPMLAIPVSGCKCGISQVYCSADDRFRESV